MKITLLKCILLGLLAMFVVYLPFNLGSIETGQVGLKRWWSGKIEQEEMTQGFYQSFFSNVKKFSVKQIPIRLEDLQPKAKDNLSLAELDVVVYYTVNPDSVSNLYTEFQNSIVENDDGVLFPAYKYVHNLARSATNDAISRFESMELNRNRNEIERMIREELQKELDTLRANSFKVDRVNITNILTDPSVEDKIRQITNSDNQRAIAENDQKVKTTQVETERRVATTRAKTELEVAQMQAETYRIRTAALNDKILAEKQLQVLEKMAESQNKVFVIPQNFNGILNLNQ